MTDAIQLNKSHNHDHFWIEDNFAYESYNTIRGLRYRQICGVDYPDTEKLSEVDILLINSQLKNIKSK